MSVNLYIIRHGKIITEEKNRSEYLHLSNEGNAFTVFLDKYFKDIYFDQIFYQSKDIKTSDPYNRCRQTIRGMKGVKTEYDKTQISRIFEELNNVESDVRNVLICFKPDAFNVINNIINAQSDEEFNKDYHRVFHYTFNSNNYSFVSKFTAEEQI